MLPPVVRTQSVVPIREQRSLGGVNVKKSGHNSRNNFRFRYEARLISHNNELMMNKPQNTTKVTDIFQEKSLFSY